MRTVEVPVALLTEAQIAWVVIRALRDAGIDPKTHTAESARKWFEDQHK